MSCDMENVFIIAVLADYGGGDDYDIDTESEKC